MTDLMTVVRVCLSLSQSSSQRTKLLKSKIVHEVNFVNWLTALEREKVVLERDHVLLLQNQ
jgi:hypothetical protein